MDFVKEWTLCVCTTLVASVIFSLITPSGRLSVFYKSVIALFIFISFINPFTNFKLNNIDFDIDNMDNSSSLVVNMVDNQVKNVLVNHSVIGANVKSDVERNGDEIVINSIDVFIPDDYDEKDVHDIIFDELSINARVIHNGS